ncbi:hypothetical protein HCC36_10830 [Listeria booriae]|uniref:Uncharacterized protein n=1 Tax=Listeria booriae TaxID=1552123 RepID=A0A842GAU7_9LIST|nr:hypothetical protein [Listeria booriae]MBC2293722.1 hypothetical protein [Listeria booriae]
MRSFEGLLDVAQNLTAAYKLNKEREDLVSKVGSKIKEAAACGKDRIHLCGDLQTRVIDMNLTPELANEGFKMMAFVDSIEISWAKK